MRGSGLCVFSSLFAIAGVGHMVRGLTIDKVVYQTDDRTDVCNVNQSDPFVWVARNAVVAMVDAGLASAAVDGDLTATFAHYRPIGLRHNLCADERFLDQPTAAMCSGTLIGVDRVLTAGHCMDSFKCATRKFVFNYFLDYPNCSMHTITVDDVYSCRRFERIETDQIDFAVVQLDRPVINHQPAQVQKQHRSLAVGDRLVVAGFGSGLPLKLDFGGRVITPRQDLLDYFVASTDTFAGNSGSGVFDSCGLLVGILVRGQRDYVRDGTANCNRVSVTSCTSPQCAELKDAEEITYAFRAVSYAPDCNTDADCRVNMICDRPCPANHGSCSGWCVSAETQLTSNANITNSTAAFPSPLPLLCSPPPLGNNSTPSPTPTSDSRESVAKSTLGVTLTAAVCVLVLVYVVGLGVAYRCAGGRHASKLRSRAVVLDPKSSS